MTLVGISVDPVAASRRMAGELGIGFALVSDANLVAARAYVGVDDHDFAVPGVVVVRPDGSIAFRQIAHDKADRTDAAQLLAVLDDAFGRPDGAPAAHGGYASVDRAQLGIALGGGVVDGDDATARATATALLPLGRHVLVGTMIDGEARTGWLAVDAALTLRQPILGDQGALQLTARGGRTLFALDGWHVAGRTTLSFAVRPDWAIELGLDLGAHQVGHATNDPTLDVAATVGVTRLVRLR